MGTRKQRRKAGQVPDRAPPEPQPQPQPRRGWLTRVWQGLSRPWRWVLVVAPGVALVLGLVGDSLSLWDRLTGDEPAVSVQDVAVSQQGVVDLVQSSIADDYRRELRTAATSVTFSLNNPQPTSVAFYQVRATVLDAAEVADCFVAAGPIQVTGDYQLRLPDAERGARTSVGIAWEVPGDANDRFRLTLGHPALTTLERVPFYHLEIELRTGDGTWLPAGRVVVVNELPHFGAFFDVSDDEGGRCAAENVAVMRAFLEKEGERSPELTLYAEAVKAINEGGVVDYLGPDCPLGTPTVNDVHPANLIRDSDDLEVAVVVECRRADGFHNVGAIVEIVSPEQPDVALATYSPLPELRATGLDVVDGALLLGYFQLEGDTGGVEEELAVVGDTLALVARRRD